MLFLVLAMQSACSVLLLTIFSRLNLLTHRKLTAYDAKRWFPITIALVLMIYTGGKAVKYMAISLFTVFKNLTIILIAYGEVKFFKGSPVTPMILGSFCLLILSSVIAGWSDISSGNVIKKGQEDVGIIVPYFWMAANCLTSAFFGLYFRAKIKEFEFKDFDTIYYNSLLSVPVLGVCSLLFEGQAFADSYARFVSPGADSGQLLGLVISITISSLSAFAISYGISWCIRVTSSTTYSMVGALNKLPISISGMIFFSEPVTFGSVSGVFLAFIGGLFYAYAKQLQSQAQQAFKLPVPVTDRKHTRDVSVRGDNMTLFDADDYKQK
ncbi:GDP-mannose transporter into the lumen of the Golgi [Rhizoclosmatium sp. JEL0117]|nr:GDP-mannose transporter into the lumen of the Golgi [Rhizoclosmatium sp. JEL0117]